MLTTQRKGDLETSTPIDENRPSDDEFKLHLGRVLNPDPAPPPLRATPDVTIPIPNDPILSTEVDCQIRKLKEDKAYGPDGLAQCMDLTQYSFYV